MLPLVLWTLMPFKANEQSQFEIKGEPMQRFHAKPSETKA
jgi:hypothetical protein